MESTCLRSNFVARLVFSLDPLPGALPEVVICRAWQKNAPPF
jgi:hypothetical protein